MLNVKPSINNNDNSTGKVIGMFSLVLAVTDKMKIIVFRFMYYYKTNVSETEKVT